MEEKKYQITLADGTILGDLKLNGNNYISKEKIAPDLFDGNCSPVIISDGTSDEIHNDMELVQVTEVSGEYWFVLRDLTDKELATIKMQSDIEYVAMMAGIEL